MAADIPRWVDRALRDLTPSGYVNFPIPDDQAAVIEEFKRRGYGIEITSEADAGFFFGEETTPYIKVLYRCGEIVTCHRSVVASDENRGHVGHPTGALAEANCHRRLIGSFDLDHPSETYLVNACVEWLIDRYEREWMATQVPSNLDPALIPKVLEELERRGYEAKMDGRWGFNLFQIE